MGRGLAVQELPNCHPFRERSQAIQDRHAVEMIEFVLNRGAEQTFRDECEGLPITIHGRNRDCARAVHVLL